MNSEKVILIGLDGATWKLLDGWINAGELPNLAKLCSEGVRGTLLSTVPSTTCPALPAMFTGKNPAELGIFTFLDASGSPVLLNNIPGPKMWDVLARKGIASCVIDVRFTYPPASINGVMTCSTPLPPNAKQLYYPPDLHEQLGRKVPLATDYHGKIYRQGDFDERKEEVLGHLRDYLEDRYQLIRDLTLKNDYGFVFTWFGDVDWMQHLYWHDPDTILRHMKTVDEYIGRFARDFKGSNIIIISDHGFHKQPQSRFFINSWLMQNGFLNTNRNAPARWFLNHAVLAYRKVINNRIIRRWLRHRKPGPKSKSGENAALKDVQRNVFPSVDWNTTRAYFFGPWGISIIKENLDGDYEKFRSQLIKKMKSALDSCGRSVFAHVWKKEEIFKGRYLSQVPDIIYQLHEEYIPDPLVTSTKLFGKFARKARYRRTGTHENDREGIFIGNGSAFSTTQIKCDSRIEDIAPTIYHILACNIPDNLDGRVMTDALSDEMKKISPHYYAPVSAEQEKAPETISADDEESVKDQLRDMGYLSD